MTLETAGAVPKTHLGRRPLDLSRLRSWVYVNFAMGMGIGYAGACTLRHWVAANKKETTVRKSISMRGDLESKLWHGQDQGALGVDKQRRSVCAVA